MLIQKADNLGLDYVELKATADGYPLYRKLGFQDFRSDYTDMRLICSCVEQ